MKLQKNDIFAAFKDSRRQLSRFKTGVLFNDSNELVKKKGRFGSCGLASTAGFGSWLPPPQPQVHRHTDPELALDDPTCVISYKMVLLHKPLKYIVFSHYPSRCLRGHCGLASNPMKKSPYSPFGTPARYSYLDATRGILARNQGHFQREASCRKQSMNEGFGHGTRRWATGLIVHHVSLNPREYGRNAGDAEHRTCPSSSPVDAPTVSKRSGMASPMNRPGRFRRINHERSTISMGWRVGDMLLCAQVGGNRGTP